MDAGRRSGAEFRTFLIANCRFPNPIGNRQLKIGNSLAITLT